MTSAALALDTAGPVIGVALWDGARAFARTLRLQRGAEERLPELIEAVCRDGAVALRDVAGIGVAIGPGAFTGLRVGVATAGGLASALGVPVWPVSSLVPRAARAGFGGDLLAMLDARKGRLYAAHWRDELLARPAADVGPGEALAWAEGRPFRATGEGALLCRAEIEARGGEVVADAEDPGTGLLARWCAEALARGEGIDPASLRTEYVREPDAVTRLESR